MLGDLVAPVIEAAVALLLVALAAFGVVTWRFVGLAALLSVALGTVQSLLALAIVGSVQPAHGWRTRMRRLAALVLADLGWRQLETTVRAVADLQNVQQPNHVDVPELVTPGREEGTATDAQG
jgi:hypothetical protein